MRKMIGEDNLTSNNGYGYAVIIRQALSSEQLKFAKLSESLWQLIPRD